MRKIAVIDPHVMRAIVHGDAVGLTILERQIPDDDVVNVPQVNGVAGNDGLAHAHNGFIRKKNTARGPNR